MWVSPAHPPSHPVTQSGAGGDAQQVAAYRYIDGMPALLGQLQEAQVPMHIMSNYPTWYR
jgi:hypothetical protein